jgi:ABC-type multidrug transport system ATPase subunit
MLTPREILNLAAFLQLDLDQSDQDKIVGNILDSLGLKSVESRRIGDQAGSSSGHLSGGERRRLSAGMIVSTLDVQEKM